MNTAMILLIIAFAAPFAVLAVGAFNRRFVTHTAVVVTAIAALAVGWSFWQPGRTRQRSDGRALDCCCCCYSGVVAGDIGLLIVVTEHAHEDPSGAEIRRDLHLGDAEEPDARILHLPPDDIVELLLEQLAHLSCPSCHGRSRTFRGESRPRRPV